MTYQMTVSPDFSPRHIAGWYIFNTWLQKTLGEDIHLELYQDFESQRKSIREDKIDLIYANPFDASMLIREKGFIALARPLGKEDEVVIAVPANSPVNKVEELQPGLRLAFTDDPNVHLVGMIMLEPANLSSENIRLQMVDSYAVVAKQLLRGEADAGIFLKEAFYGLSSLTRREMRPLVESQISDIFHAFLVGPRLADKKDVIQDALARMTETPGGRSVLEALGIAGWANVSREDAEFMVDLMDAIR